MAIDAAGFEARLKDGRTVRVRPTRASDESELLQTFHRMSPEARHMRFMGAVAEPDLERLRSALASLGDKVVGVVATVDAPDGFDIVGSAVLVVGNDPSTCEFAVSVSSDVARSGLGRVLMSALIDIARSRGLRVMEGDVLASNQPMLRLAARLGFAISSDPGDATLRICRLRLDQAHPSTA